MALDTWPIKSHVFKPGVTEIPKLEDANLAGTKHSEELQKKTRRVSVALHGYVAKSLVLSDRSVRLSLQKGIVQRLGLLMCLWLARTSLIPLVDIINGNSPIHW